MKKMLKNLVASLLVLALVFSGVAFSAETKVSASEDCMEGQLVILHTNDIHGKFEMATAVDETTGETVVTNMGVATVKKVKEYYESHGADVILMDAGDFAQGELLVNHYDGRSAVRFMNSAGYDVASLGNHEFDKGYEAMLKLVELAEFPIVDANIVSEETGEVFFEANTIFEFEGLTVGVFGLDTAETLTKSSPLSVKGLDFLDGEEMFECAQAQVDELKEAGCDVIICLGHLGTDDESTGRRSSDLLAAVDGIDLFVDGHSHSVYENGLETEDGLIVSAGTKLQQLGVVIYDGEDFEANLYDFAELSEIIDEHPTYKVVAGDTLSKIAKKELGAAKEWKQIYELNKDIIKNPDLIYIGQEFVLPASHEECCYDVELDAYVDKFVNKVAAIYEGEFAVTEVDLNGERAPGVRTEETNLGDFAADAYKFAAQQYADEAELGITIDGAIQNGGGIRASIPAGSVSMGALYTVFPYGNSVTIIAVTGAELLEALEASCAFVPEAVGGFPQVTGIEFEIDSTVPFENGEQYPNSTYYAPANPGARVTIKTVGGKEFNAEDTYYLSVNNFMAEGGDTYYVFSQASEIIYTGVVDADALIAYVESLDGVISAEDYAEEDGWITIK